MLPLLTLQLEGVIVLDVINNGIEFKILITVDVRQGPLPAVTV